MISPPSNTAPPLAPADGGATPAPPAAPLRAEPTREDDSTPASPPAFRCGEREYTLDDVLHAAQCLGELPRFRTEWLAREQAASVAEAAGLIPDDSAVEEAVEAFRYARDLVSGEECERWLAARGLTSDDLVGCIGRRVQAELAGPDATEEPSVVNTEHFRRDAVLADEFSDWARRLAWRIAAAADTGRFLRNHESVTAAWSELESAFVAAVAACVTPERRQRALLGERLRLKRIAFHCAEFDSVDAAREAILCAREDGTSLDRVAASNGFPCRTMEEFLGDLPPLWAGLLTSARVGELVMPGAESSGVVVLSVISRTEPSLADETVCGRIDGELVQRHFRESEATHIRWLLNLEIAS